MCLAVPGKIKEVYEKDNVRMGKVDFGGVVKETCLAYVPRAAVGDWIVAHVGFAINVLNEEEAGEVHQLAHAAGQTHTH
ncbi:MAG: HypC/HybG/HupF family hydrogenase formation chaperone [Patescibacteria group bacterium]